ncbi:hypothetical protein N0V88_005883 [Collariella sp. IMI 366227]|nr:hypothetical protein N0V88_005883 [Collariella sp. IMI 366227]
MERDSKRARGQWRGCYSFKDIVCDGDAGAVPKRNGGLKMGHTYYYYYELDGVSETHDPSQPSTNTCPYLPGQTVNTLWIPVEQSGRKRSASLSSIHEEDFKTMDPASKFLTPRPAPPPPEPIRRVGTALPRLQDQKRSASPSSSWIFSPRKLFSRNIINDPSLGRQPLAGHLPESLRRFLVDTPSTTTTTNTPTTPTPTATTTPRPAIHIPYDIVEENEPEDDDNFATLPISALQPMSPRSPDTTSLPGFEMDQLEDDIDDDEEDEDDLSDELVAQQKEMRMKSGNNPFARNWAAALSTYSLPRTAGSGTERKLDGEGWNWG